MNHDIHVVASHALSSAHQLIPQLLPNGKREGPEWVALNPKRDDRKLGSFKVNTATGKWQDFATGEGGGDLVSLYAYLGDMNQGEAANELAQRLGVGSNSTPAPSMPAKAPRVEIAGDYKEAARKHSAYWMGQGYKPEALHTYTDQDGKPIFWRVRLRHPDGNKKIFPMSHQGNNKYAKAEPDFPSGRKPIYNQFRIAKRPDDAMVYVVEGEKCADALTRLGILATTSGSATSAGGADWTPLEGRSVVIWPDNDDEGAKYAGAVKSQLTGIARDVRLVDVKQLGLAEKGDCADWLITHPSSTADDIRVLPTVEFEQAVGGKEDLLSVLSVPPQPLSGVSEPEALPCLPDVKPLDFDALPDVLRAYVHDIAERMQCPPDFPAATCLAMAGAAIGRKIGIRPKRADNWTVTPNQWAMIVGKSGIMKSPAISAAIGPLRKMQAEAFKAFEEEMERHEVQVRITKLKLEEAERQARGMVKNGKTGEASRLLEDAQGRTSEPPTAKRYIINDSTVEALAETLEENPNGVLVDRDELSGWLRSLDKEGQQEARAFYLTAADGDKGFTTDRIGRGRGRHIPAVCVSIVGAIQPGVLASYVRETQRGGPGDDGLLQRFGIMVYPDVSPQWKNIDRAPDESARSAVDHLLKRLCRLDPFLIGAESDPYQPIPFLRFDADAQSLFDEWRADLENRIRQDDEHPAIVSHLSKYRKLVPGLALIYHLCGGLHGSVNEEALARALMMADYLESHARRVYSYASRPDVEGAKAILAKIRNGKLPTPFKAAQVYRAGWSGLSTAEEAWPAIRLLLDFGYLLETRNDDTGGRPSQVFHPHPSIKVSA